MTGISQLKLSSLKFLTGHTWTVWSITGQLLCWTRRLTTVNFTLSGVYTTIY